MTGRKTPGFARDTRPIRSIDSVRGVLTNAHVAESLASVATRHLGPEKLMRVAMGACQTTPKLLDCEPMSFLRGLMTCAKLGLEPNNEFGSAFLIPFWNGRKKISEVQLIIGYKGYLQLAHRHPDVVSIHADVAYDDDEVWEYEYGSEMKLRHRPGPREGNPTHAYCHVRLTDGQAFIVLPWAQILKTRDGSQGWQRAVRDGKEKSSPWYTHLDAMARKTAVRRLASSGEMPMQTEMMDLMLADAGQPPKFEIGADGQMVEGVGYEVGDDPESDADGALVEDQKPAPEPEPEQRQPRGKPAGKAPARGGRKSAPPAKPEPDPDPAPEGEEADEWPEEIGSVVERILTDAEEAVEAGDPERLEEGIALFEDEIRSIGETHPAHHTRLMQLIGQARESLGGRPA